MLFLIIKIFILRLFIFFDKSNCQILHPNTLLSWLIFTGYLPVKKCNCAFWSAFSMDILLININKKVPLVAKRTEQKEKN